MKEKVPAPTIPSALVPLYLRLTKANKSFVTAEGARNAALQTELRPAPFGPPIRLRPGITIDVHHENGWPVYTITPSRTDRQGSVVYVHGGGWVHEIAPQHWTLAAQIAVEANTTVTVPIYPLVPRGTARPVVDTVVGMVSENMSRYGRTCLAGDSAGGQIALSTALALRDRHQIELPSLVLISPALDLTLSNACIASVQPTDPWLGTAGARVLAELWKGDLDIRDPTVSPLNANMAGLGPIMLLSGTRDILNPDAHLLLKKLREANIPVEYHEGAGQLHVYPLLPTNTGRAARRMIVNTLRAALTKA